MKYLIDAYAWIEYLEGSEKGKVVKNILNDNNEIFTLALTISEVVSRIKRKGLDAEAAAEAIQSNAKILDISAKAAKEAGVFHAEMREKISDFGLVDAILYTIAQAEEAKVVTGDPHFKGFKNVVFLK